MLPIREGDIARAADLYMRPEVDRAVGDRRERSWDFCFTHFQRHPRPTEAMELSCLHLGYYLASWGMLRGSSYLFRTTNVLHYERAVEVIERYNPRLRGFDVDRYRDAGQVQVLTDGWTDLRHALIPDRVAGVTLVSKVMMGVWGCIPSFDTYFVRTFRGLSETTTERRAWNAVRPATLALLADVCQKHQVEIDAVRARYPVWDMTGGPGDAVMPRAKVLDIYGWQTSVTPAV